jgi:hypothetical protein
VNASDFYPEPARIIKICNNQDWMGVGGDFLAMNVRKREDLYRQVFYKVRTRRLFSWKVLVAVHSLLGKFQIHWSIITSQQRFIMIDFFFHFKFVSGMDVGSTGVKLTYHILYNYLMEVYLRCLKIQQVCPLHQSRLGL